MVEFGQTHEATVESCDGDVIFRLAVTKGGGLGFPIPLACEGIVESCIGERVSRLAHAMRSIAVPIVMLTWILWVPYASMARGCREPSFKLAGIPA